MGIYIYTGHTVSKCFSKLEKELLITSKPSRPKDLGSRRMIFDENAVKKTHEILVNWGNPFNYRQSLINICSGIEASPDVEKDLILSEENGENALTSFVNSRIKSNDISFYAPIKKQSLKTFKDMVIKKICKTKEKAVTIAAERSIFARLLIIGKSREGVSLKDILSYSLSPIPWSLATPDGGLVKTAKSKLLAAIERSTVTVDIDLPPQCGMIHDGMVLLQQLEGIQLNTFGDVSEYILKRITFGSAPVIYFVTDQYKSGSIKSFERRKRGDGGSVRVKVERREQKKPKQWGRFMKDGENKTSLVKFLLEDWADETRFIDVISYKKIYVNVESKFFVLQVENGSVTCSESEELETEQEEADTKVFLCCAHAASAGLNDVCISTVDTDIAIYALYFNDKISVRIIVQIGVGSRKRLLDIDDITSELGEKCCAALPALHAFTGNDYTSAFHGLGKYKAYKLMKSSDEFLELFGQLGNSFTFDATLFPMLEKFVCKLYGLKSENTNDARYEKFCLTKKSPEPQKLPPTRDSLCCHTKRTSYVTALIKRSLENVPDVPSPNGYGWKVVEGDLAIDWMLRKPAPEEILELVSCGCKRNNCGNQCICKIHGLVCTDLCGCSNCENCTVNDDTDDNSDSDSDDSDSSTDNELEEEC